MSRSVAVAFAIALAVAALSASAQTADQGYKRRVPIGGVGNGVGPAHAENQRELGNYSSCITTEGGAAGGFTYLVNHCDAALFVSYCSVGDSQDQVACEKRQTPKVIDGQRVYGSTEVLGPNGRTPVPVRWGVQVIWLACNQKSGLAYMVGETHSPGGYCGDGIPNPPEQPLTATSPESNATEPVAPVASNRTGSSVDDIFAMAIENPDQMRQQVNARPQAGTSAAASSGSADNGGADGMGMLLGALAGAYVAQRTGNTALLEMATGLPQGSMASSVGTLADQSASSGQSSAGNASQCTSLGQQFNADLARANRIANACQKMKSQLGIYESYRPRVQQICAGQPGYQTTMNDFNTQIPAYRRTMSQMGCS